MADVRIELCCAFIFFICFREIQIHGASVTRNSRAARKSADPVDYLAEYGYLSRSNQETGEMRSNEEIMRAVKNLQRVAGLPQTGDIRDPKLMEIMTKPRCGFGDRRIGMDPKVPLSFHTSDQKWPSKTITFKIEGYSKDYDQGQQRADFHRAFNIWKEAADLEFSEVHPDAKADIIISFVRQHHGDGYKFDGEGGTLAHAFPPGDGIGGDVHFDDDEIWGNMGAEGTTDLFTAAAHEFGHSLGIYHSEDKDALMFPWYKGYSPDLRLSYDDVLAIQTLYGPPRSGQVPVWIPKFETLPSTTTRPPTLPPRPPPTPRPGKDDPPNPCNTDIDAVSTVRGEVFAFKGKWFWRFDRYGVLMQDKPIKTSSFWEGLPKHLKRIDAVTIIPKDDLILFFSGDRYWVLRERSLYDTPHEGYPLTRLGLPREVNKIDAALNWGLNDRTYLFSGRIYWRLDNISRDLRVESDYPKTFDIWQGIPVPIDAAFTGEDGSTYFFKGTQFFKIDDKKMVVDPRYPQDIGRMWLNCRYTMGYLSSSVIPRSSWALQLMAVGTFLLTFVFQG